MTRTDTTNGDWAFVADVVGLEGVRQYGTREAFAEAAGVDRGWAKRALKGVPLTMDMTTKLERALDFPRGLLQDLATGDPSVIEAFHPDLDPDFKRWVFRKLSARAS